MATVDDLIRAVNEADSKPALFKAVEALSAAGSEAAIPTLIQVLGFNNPGAAVAAVDGLIRLGEPAVQPLLDQLDGYNYGARAWAVRALAGIADPRGLDILLNAAQTDFALSVRRAAARGLGLIQWEKMAPEQVDAAQETTASALQQIAIQDHEWVVRYAAVVGLEALVVGGTESGQERRSHDLDTAQSPILQVLQQVVTADPVLAVQARARHAMAQLGSAP